MSAPAGTFVPNLRKRAASASFWQAAFMAATLLAVLMLGALVFTIVDDSFGYVTMEWSVDPAELAPDGKLDALAPDALRAILEERLPPRRLRALERETPLTERPRENLVALVTKEIVDFQVRATFGLVESVFAKNGIERRVAEEFPGAVLSFRAWLNPSFLTGSQSATAMDAGIRSAILGTLMTILVAILAAFPVGIGAAVWLEEYAKDNALNRFIRLNIYNLAGVPSIIYGMLGLAIFVRGLEPITSGAVFGAVADPLSANGRTVLSAGLTLGILILPLVIINAQEALRAVPRSLRESGYAVGATKLQTIRALVLPSCFDRVLTGTIIAVSRAIGETAPLVVIGASTFLTREPTSPFAKFTTLPIQIYQWTARPQADFRNIAAAAILALLILMLSLNAAAIILRGRLRAKKRSHSR